ncbi:MAG TPA: D-arabinono-1,4-lactone oxidase [Fontimonas sp.]
MIHRKRSWTNWSGTVQCEPSHCAYPINVEQIQAEVLRVAEEGERLRVIGGGHSFSPLCWTDDNHLSLDRFTGIESIDVNTQQVWVRAGTRLRRLAEALGDRRLALINAPDNDQLTLAGALATASHGSGAAFGSLAAQVTGLRMVCAAGSQRSLSATNDPDDFHAAVVSLGALGVITHVELQCVEDYRLHVAHHAATLAETLAGLEDWRAKYRNLELFWYPHTDTVIARHATLTDALPSTLSPLRNVARAGLDRAVFRTLARTARRAPKLSERLGRLAVRQVSNRSSIHSARDAYALRQRNRFQQLEYALPRSSLKAVLRSLENVVRALDIRVHFPLEIRFVAKDNFWLSPFYQRDSVCISVPAYTDTAFEKYYALIAELMERHDGRPHWGMVHDLSAEQLRPLYPRFDDFRAVRRKCDPRGVFLNPHLATLLGETMR